jgi:Family of unknown function (DUF6988)
MKDQSMGLLDDISTRGAEIRAQLRELLHRHEYGCDTKTLVLVSYVDLALEHHEAIWLLRKSELTGSAFALVRPVLDILFRALWINAVATEQQVEQASRDELYFPPMHEMRDDIKERYSDKSCPKQAELFDILLRRLKDAWKTMSSYTHPGGHQITRRFTFDEVKPNYGEDEIACALNLSTFALLLLMRMFWMSLSAQREADEIAELLAKYSAEFNERLNNLSE